MVVFRGLHTRRSDTRGCGATLGNLEGGNHGKQAVVKNVRERAAALGVPTRVVTFEPQPQEFCGTAAGPARLTRMREKLQALKDAGIDRVVLLEFGQKLASMTASQFVQELLVDGLDVRLLFVGDDFRFGRGRVGDIHLLRQVGAAHGFEVANMNTFMDGEARISSTRIREALARGDLDLAERNLGRPYQICGRVAHGDARGRTIGFPTANIDLHRKVSPVHGVFAVMVHGLAEGPLPGVANIGNRPTVTGDSRYLLEVHLFDFARVIYGEHVQVEFRKRLRDERRFESFDALRRQIERDAAQARAFFGIDK